MVLCKHYCVNDSCEFRNSLNQPVGCLLDSTVSLNCYIFSVTPAYMCILSNILH